MNKKTVIIIISSVLAAVILAVGLYFLITKVFLKNENETKIYKNPTIVVESVEGKVGETVKVPVRVYKNPGVMAYVINFGYDTSALSYVDYESGDFLTDYQFSTHNGTLTFVNLENKDIKEDGVMVYLKFRILETDKDKTEIEIKLNGQDAANSKEQYIKFEGENGTVTIK